MEGFDDYDEKYRQLCITQSGEGDIGVSLEEDNVNEVKLQDYSDISDFEDDGEMEKRLRWVLILHFGFVCWLSFW